MAITSAGSGSTGNTATLSTTSETPTAAALPTGSNRCAVLQIAQATAVAPTNTITLGGQSPDFSYVGGQTNFWEGRGAVYVWVDSTIASMSGTTLSMSFSSSTFLSWNLHYFEGVDQTTTVRSNTLSTDDTFDPTGITAVVGDMLVMMAQGKKGVAPASYDGTGTEMYAHGDTSLSESIPAAAYAYRLAASTTESDSFTITTGSEGPWGGWGALVLIAASGGGGPTADVDRKAIGRGMNRGHYRGAA